MESMKQAIFYLDEKEYGMDVMDVSTIEKCVSIGSLENAPKNFTGIINIRGESIPVYSLRNKFGMSGKEQDADTRLIITKSNSVTMAYEVDKIRGIVDTTSDLVYEVPTILNSVETKYLKSFLSLEDKLVPILETDGIVTEEELEYIKDIL